MNLLRKATTPPVECAVFGRAQAEVRRMRSLFEVRESRAVHVHRAWCEDCSAVVELLDNHRCFCGSRSVMPARPRRVA